MVQLSVHCTEREQRHVQSAHAAGTANSDVCLVHQICLYGVLLVKCGAEGLQHGSPPAVGKQIHLNGRPSCSNMGMASMPCSRIRAPSGCRHVWQV